MRKLTTTDIDSLYGAILTLESIEEARAFFRDLLTESEIDEFAERWKVAQMIARDVPYTRIIEETGLSSTTIARVARWVHHGKGGYRRILQRTGVIS